MLQFRPPSHAQPRRQERDAQIAGRQPPFGHQHAEEEIDRIAEIAAVGRQQGRSDRAKIRAETVHDRQAERHADPYQPNRSQRYRARNQNQEEEHRYIPEVKGRSQQQVDGRAPRQRPAAHQHIDDRRHQPGQQHALAIAAEEMIPRLAAQPLDIEQIARYADHQRHAESGPDPQRQMLRMGQFHGMSHHHEQDQDPLQEVDRRILPQDTPQSHRVFGTIPL